MLCFDRVKIALHSFLYTSYAVMIVLLYAFTGLIFDRRR